jgi:hypothetical protein
LARYASLLLLYIKTNSHLPLALSEAIGEVEWVRAEIDFRNLSTKIKNHIKKRPFILYEQKGAVSIKMVII